MTCGIYKITNIITNMIYLGQSINIEKRLNNHKNYLNKNKHPNEHLQRVYNKYGKPKFIFEIIVICEKSELDIHEQALIDLSESYKPNIGYNLTLGGDGGQIPNEQTRLKMSITRQGKKPTIETNKKRSEALKGKPWTKARRAAQTLEVNNKFLWLIKENQLGLDRNSQKKLKLNYPKQQKINGN